MFLYDYAWLCMVCMVKYVSMHAWMYVEKTGKQIERPIIDR